MVSFSLRTAGICKEDAGPQDMAYITLSSDREGLKEAMNNQDRGFGLLPPLKTALRQDNAPAEMG